MKKPHNKSFLFLIVGIFIGILLGGAFVYIWYQQLNMKTFEVSFQDFYKSFSGEKDTIAVRHKDLIFSDEDKLQDKNQLRATQTTSTSSSSSGESVDSVDTDIFFSSDNDIIVRDELFFAKSIKIDNYQVKVPDRADSLLFENKNNAKKEKVIQVEFWRSPINYSGYRFANDKLVLFGITNPDSVALDYQNDTFTLVYRNLKYTLQNTEEFINLNFRTVVK